MNVTLFLHIVISVEFDSGIELRTQLTTELTVELN